MENSPKLKIRLKVLSLKMKEVLFKNSTKIFFVFFLLIVLQSLSSFIFTAPAAWLMMKAEQSSLYTIAGLSVVFLGMFMAFMVLSGFAVMLLRMVRSEKVTLGYMFLGFRRFKQFFPGALAASLTVLAVCLIMRLVNRYVFYSESIVAKKAVEFAGAYGDILFVLLITSAVIIVLLYGQIYVQFFKYDNKNLSIFYCLSESYKLSFKGLLFSILFFLVCAGRNIALTLFYSGMSVAFSGNDEGSPLNLLTIIFEFLYFMNICKIAAILCLSFPILYEEKRKQDFLELLLRAFVKMNILTKEQEKE